MKNIYIKIIVNISDEVFLSKYVPLMSPSELKIERDAIIRSHTCERDRYNPLNVTVGVLWLKVKFICKDISYNIVCFVIVTVYLLYIF